LRPWGSSYNQPNAIKRFNALVFVCGTLWLIVTKSHAIDRTDGIPAIFQSGQQFIFLSFVIHWGVCIFFDALQFM
jgi:hypothetical protein